MKTRRAKDYDRLYEVMRVLRKLSAINDLQTLLDQILKSARKAMSAEASSLMLLDHAADELYFREARGGRDVKEIRLKVGQGVAGRVARTGKPMIVNDVTRSPYFFGGVDKETGFVTRQILCVPLVARKTVIGVLEVLNKAGGEDFNREDLLLFSNFAGHAAVAIENARLYNLAAYDGLTQVFTRGHFDAWFASEFARAQRYRRELSLLLIDVDHFKLINDEHGHPAGDVVIAGVARLVREALRSSDLVARYGGDELVVALTETAGEPARLVAERIRLAVEKHPFSFEGRAIRVTVSVGVASLRRDAEPATGAIVAEADQALYRAKRLRNAVSGAEFSGKRRA